MGVCIIAEAPPRPDPENQPVSKKQASPLARHHLALDKEIAMRYVTWLVEKRIADGTDTRRAFCRECGYDLRLLERNPHVGAITRLFQDQPSIDRLGELTLREYLTYQHYYVSHGERYGAPKLQSRWLGEEVDRTPWDLWVCQEIISETRPDFVIEVGASGGGAAVFYASVLELRNRGEVLVVGATAARQRSGPQERMRRIEGAAASRKALEQVEALVAGKRVLAVIGSGRQREDRLAVLRAYAPFVNVGSYLIVEGVLEPEPVSARGAKAGSRAVAREFLQGNDDFVADRRFAERYVMTSNPDGFLLRVS
jgi:cephalosporin hydroxylase